MQLDNNNANHSNTKQRNIRFIVFCFLIILFYNLFNSYRTDNIDNINKINYTQFLDKVKSNQISNVILKENRFGSKTIVAKSIKDEQFAVQAPQDSSLVSTLISHNVNVEATYDPPPGLFYQLFMSLLPTFLFLGIFFLILKNIHGGKSGPNGGIFSFNKNKATLILPEQINESFSDVVGCDSAKADMQELVDILKNPTKYDEIGGKIPKGVLLTGHSGTGKTMLAKALAKESGVPFYATSGSEFVEMIVGVGAGRVRSMFAMAKEHAPCIIFIDEIDALGKRGSNSNFSHDEKEQTLNQMLVEMDGISSNAGIIVVGATNRPEMLDPALLRPGRIDRQIRVELPDIKGRKALLEIYAKKRPLAEDVNLNYIAAGTPGFSGADLANLINEAALFAVRENRKTITQKNLENAKDRIMLGAERPDLSMTEEDKRDTAFHEAGHAIVAMVVPNSDPVHKVTIVPRGKALGVTMQIPETEKFTHKKEYLIDKICILMGGRAAEEVFCNTLTSGAQNDIQVATHIAKNMVMQLGMSDLGPISIGNIRGSEFNNGSYLDLSGSSPALLQKAETIIQDLLQEQYLRAKNILLQYRKQVETMTELLMKNETIGNDEIKSIMNS